MSGGWDADPRPPTLWRRDPVGEAWEASGSRCGSRWRPDPASRRPDPASDGREAAASGGPDADPRPLISWRPDPVGGGGGGVRQSVGEALAAGRRAGRGSTSPNLVEAGSSGGDGGGVRQSMGEVLAAGFGVRWPGGRRGVGGGGGRRSGGGETWEVGRKKREVETVGREEVRERVEEEERLVGRRKREEEIRPGGGWVVGPLGGW
ncbi:hypothetical protein OsJ_27020 [Oryza sativa Japonica Group]|uniref:Uncharacterized protein n=1 Tax=Oryza sativa subsp. japonica TaxID=39947 RepID=Q6YX59_ORYSJ|nr:hypothetical protein OsJ_27020 [Oryza sativa Japonica Group]BAD03844.1 hypothetical protein [Oryza sativa Japonica Group]